jgi:hypothetical protein
MFQFLFQLGGFGCLIAVVLFFVAVALLIALGAVIWPAVVAVLLVVVLPLALIKKLIALARPKDEPLQGGTHEEVRPREHMSSRPDVIDAEFTDIK